MAKENGTAGSVSDEEKQLQEDMDELSKIGDIEVENGILTVSITLPAEYMEGVTQEQLDAGKGTTYQSATLNDDGSVTYKMTKQQHREMLKSMSDSVDQSMQELIDDDNYMITGITHNDDYTVFDVTLEGTEVGFADSFTSMVFYMYGGMYGIFSGTETDHVVVNFLDPDGNVIESFDSKNMSDVSASDDSNESNPSDAADYAAQLDKEEYTYDDGYGSTYHFIVLKNNSDQTLTIATNSVAYNGSGDKIGADSGHLDALGPQSEQLVIESFDNVSDVDHFDTTISASKAKWYEDATANIEVEADVLGDKVIITCTNNGDEPAQSVEGRVIFLKDGECVGFLTNYFMNEDGKLKLGESLTKQFDYYNGTFDEAKYYIAGTISK